MPPEPIPAHWPSIPVLPGLTVETVRGMPALPPDIDRLIDAIWQARLAQPPRLFNGRVFSADRIQADRIIGYWSEYRRVFAQMTHPELFGVLRLQPLAVNGVLHTPDGIVMGRREAASTYLAGYWHTPPAGSVESRQGEDDVDLAREVLAEAEEELGLPPALLTVHRPFRAVRHPRTHVVDIGIRLITDLPFTDIRRHWKQAGNGEYDTLAVVPHHQEAEWTARADVLPSTRLFLM
ncbi:NUDIX hydrolase [Gluconacetobacter azotocaptans]|uniref:NUDIX hydrolase n=1 Tax=Gluconacetobacter azotocaptans TaxID=142834 RepID=A0A7W4PDF8_9PROT|nr:NUDIX hydrolase [Gluconacetobacter azotocaptans]MBB2189660.1 NUDIX hydrolase [Gluconacetobacter azotocaptans]GBQ29310.1 NUDIX hydrolase [Gluconacetobacter azotocaptans DSM 13594]